MKVYTVVPDENGDLQPDTEILTLGTTSKPAQYRLIEYSEVNHNRNTGAIDILPGSTIDEGTFTVIQPPPANGNLANAQAYKDKETLANLSDQQYSWQPDPNNEDTWITGYKKDVSLDVRDDGSFVFRLRVLGLKQTSTTNPTVPFVEAIDNGANVAIKVQAVNADAYTVQYCASPFFPENNNDRPIFTIATDSTEGTFSLEYSSIPNDQNIRENDVSSFGYYYRARSIKRAVGATPAVMSPFSQPVVAMPSLTGDGEDGPGQQYIYLRIPRVEGQDSRQTIANVFNTTNIEGYERQVDYTGLMYDDPSQLNARQTTETFAPDLNNNVELMPTTAPPTMGGGS